MTTGKYHLLVVRLDVADRGFGSRRKQEILPDRMSSQQSLPPPSSSSTADPAATGDAHPTGGAAVPPLTGAAAQLAGTTASAGSAQSSSGGGGPTPPTPGAGAIAVEGGGDSGGPSKKQATQGQWRTPPLPFFPSGPHGGAAAAAPSATAAPPPAAVAPPIPASSDDYAKALQEAYRRGAEAAAKMGAAGAAAEPSFDFDNFVSTSSGPSPAPVAPAVAQPPPAGQPPQPQAQTPQQGPTQPPAAVSAAMNAAASCPNLSNLGVIDIDPTPVAEIKEKLRLQAVMEQQQAQQYHHPGSVQQPVAHQPPPHQAHQHPQEPDPQMVTAQRQAAAARSAQFPGLSPLQGPSPHPPGAGAPASSYARSSSMEAVPSAAAATPPAKPPPPPTVGTTSTGVVNPLAAPQPRAPSTATQPQGTTTTGVPTPLPLGPMRIPGMPPGAPRPGGPPPGAPGQPMPPPSAPQPQPQHPGAAAPYAPPPPRAVAAAPHPGATVASAPGAATAPTTTTPSGVPVPSAAVVMQGQPRSVSLPDMSSYAARADAEEAKRRKRLARNRASARLRRLRKKNLVDSYEGEVGVLESSLAKLRSHRWGAGADHEALLEALSMERGQQNIDASQRRELIQSILAQQREQVANVMECQLENMVLGWIAGRGGEGSSEGAGAKVKNGDGTVDGEADQLAKELEDVLRLTPDQKSRLVKATDGVEQERKAIETVDSCLEAMMTHSWLTNAGVEECAEQFMSILNPGQVSKFLLWTDHNSESIDRLDYVRAPPAGAPPQNGPTFAFGMDDAALGDDPADQ